MKATRKFVDFLLAFPTTPPVPRSAFGQLDWTPTAMERHLKTIYKLRSKDLHEGIPFPMARCKPPIRDEQGIFEIPGGLATHSDRATWAPKDTPMNLHIFKHIVRQALRAWWQTMP